MRTVFTLLALALLLASARPAAADAAANRCIRFWGETRYGALAYNHIVHVANSCDATADCAVSTDVNPEPQEVAVEGNTSIEVVTFMGSPARVFKPSVKCTMRQ
jgi:hypothetical protein